MSGLSLERTREVSVEMTANVLHRRPGHILQTIHKSLYDAAVQ